MDSKDENLELINVAIKRLLEESKNSEASSADSVFQGGDDDDKDEDRRLLHRLLSQLESLKANDGIQPPKSSTKPSADEELEPEREGGGRVDGDDGGGAETDTELIVKELNKVQRQNNVIQWLLSVMIVLTVAWQASEMTMLWQLKDGIRNPFRWIGGMLTGKKDSEEHHRSESPSLPFPQDESPLPFPQNT
ncbi:hypothetical protein ACFX13_012019 [Malus domestica]|uniref:Uncharacterized protein n=1 Tax=Malus domestica TaxID=3750 RepID=A0A498I902_MALDO|nr:hypothetical protein DVH24_041063 [Malus domestica]